MNGNLREYFIRCQDVDSYIIMHCNYIKGPVGITETVYTDTVIIAPAIPVKHYCCNTHLMSLSSTAGTRTAAAAAAALLKQMSVN